MLAIGTNDRVRMPRQPLSGERRAMVEKIVKQAMATRPELPKLSMAKALASPRSRGEDGGSQMRAAPT